MVKHSTLRCERKAASGVSHSTPQKDSTLMAGFRHSRTAAALAVALAVCAAPARAADLDPYVPGDTTALLVINARQALDSPVVKKYALDKVQAALKQSAEAQRLLTAAGVDPLKDVDRILV